MTDSLEAGTKLVEAPANEKEFPQATSSAKEGFKPGSKVFTKDRLGRVIIYDQDDSLLTYKVTFDDSGSSDWFCREDVRLAEREDSETKETSWTTEQALEISLEEARKALSPKYSSLGVDDLTNAVLGLTDGSLECEAGIATAYSASHRKHYIMYRSDKEAEAEEELKHANEDLVAFDELKETAKTETDRLVVEIAERSAAEVGKGRAAGRGRKRAAMRRFFRSFRAFKCLVGDSDEVDSSPPQVLVSQIAAAEMRILALQ